MLACVGKELPLSFTSGYFLHCKDEEPAGVMTICLWDSVCYKSQPTILSFPQTSDELWLRHSSMLFFYRKKFSKMLIDFKNDLLYLWGCLTYSQGTPAICGHAAREHASMCYFLEGDEMIIPTNPQTHPSLGKQTFASLFYKICIELI